ncbi:MAG: 2-phosphosulfolactate phosphatase [Candidatus Heimdallarchaeaceae archaeon]
MKITAIRPSLLDTIDSDSNSVYVVIDTFRATTSLSVLKRSGARNIYIVKNKDEAEFLKQNYFSDCLLIGEEKGIKIEGFDYGNTPSVFYNEHFSSEKVIFTSSNGAKTLLQLKSKNHVYLAALVNVSCVAKEVSYLSEKNNLEIVIIPAGIHGNNDAYSIEDWITATLLAKKIAETKSYQIEVKDEFWNRTQLIIQNQADLKKLLTHSHAAQYLQEIGYGADVDFSINMDMLNNYLKVKKWLKFGVLNCVELE